MVGLELWELPQIRARAAAPGEPLEAMRNICTWEELASHFLVGLQLADLPFCPSEQVGKTWEREREKGREKIQQWNILNPHHWAYVLPVFSTDHWDHVKGGQREPSNERLRGYSQRKETKGLQKLLKQNLFLVESFWIERSYTQGDSYEFICVPPTANT